MEPVKLAPINTLNSMDEPAGPMCRLDMKPRGLGTGTAAGTGAVSSAFIGFLV